MLPKYLNSVLMQAAPGEGGGGGGAPGGGDPPGGGEPPKYVSAEDMNKAITGAVNAHTKRQNDAFAKMLDEKIGGFGKTIEERLAALQPKPPESDDPPGGKKQTDPELIKLRQQFEQQGKAFEAEKQKRIDAETKQRDEKTRGLLRDSLAKRVRPEAVDRLMKSFFSDVKFDEAGEPTMVLADGTVTTVDGFFQAWSETEEAKVFRPAPTAGGSGSQQLRGGGTRANLTRDPAQHDPKTWTVEERGEMLRRNQEAMAKKVRDNPFGFG